jgi:hypothetical protein
MASRITKTRSCVEYGGRTMKRLMAVAGLGLFLSGCATYDAYEPYGGYSYGRPYAGYGRTKQCYEVRDFYGTPYMECRYVKRWHPHRSYARRSYSDDSYSDRRYGERRYDDSYSDRPYRERRYKEYYYD